jgi:hypothetical protein
LDGLNPEAESKVFALGIPQLPTQFLLISLFQHFQIERDSSRQVLHIVSVALNVAFRLSQCKVVRIKGKELEMLERFGKDFGESIFVVLRHMSDTNTVKVDFVLLVKRTPLHAEF